jgi:photosystem II stability/assembly factor-like uncharacterized protein
MPSVCRYAGPEFLPPPSFSAQRSKIVLVKARSVVIDSAIVAAQTSVTRLARTIRIGCYSLFAQGCGKGDVLKIGQNWVKEISEPMVTASCVNKLGSAWPLSILVAILLSQPLPAQKFFGGQTERNKPRDTYVQLNSASGPSDGRVIDARLTLEKSAWELPKDAMVKAQQHSATLRSIAAVSSDRLVAVGDRGLMLLSSNGGQDWKSISSPTTANLTGVIFQGEQGFAVGGWYGAQSEASYGVLLRSEDGGETWRSVNDQLTSLPRLSGIIRVGGLLLCWGDYSTHYGTSVFQSQDEGVSWAAAVEGLCHAAAATLNSAGLVAAVDQLGRAMIQPHGRLQPLVQPQSMINSISSYEDGWIAAGENGELIHSANGSDWFNVHLPLFSEARQLCSWRCVHQLGDSLWVVGSPGSVIVRSTNAGKDWQLFSTGQNLPLSQVCFIDASRGWAVGAMGVILATRDGGETWYTQRKSADRVGMLSIAEDSQGAPWIATVDAVWEQQLSATHLTLRHTEPIQRSAVQPTLEMLSRSSAVQIGAADFEVCDLSVTAEAECLRKIALQIATWRPSVVLYSPHHTASWDGQAKTRSIANVQRLLNQHGLDELLNQLKLENWQFSKLVTTTVRGQGQYSQDSQRVLGAYGLSIKDVLASLPYSQVQQQTQLSMQTLWCKSQSRAAQTELFGGVAFKQDSQLSATAKSLGSYQLVMGRLQRERAIQQLISSPINSQEDAKQWQSQLRFLLQSSPASEINHDLRAIVDGLLQNQRWEYCEPLLKEISLYPSELGSWASRRWLTVSGSDEFQYWARRSATTTPATPNEAAVVRSASYQDTWSNSPFQTLSNFHVNTQLPADSKPQVSEVINATATASQPSAANNESWAENPVEKWGVNAGMTFSAHPQLRSQPASLISIAKLHRKQGRQESQRELLSELARQSHLTGWSQVARQELALFDNQLDLLKWKVLVPYTFTPPTLDGQLGEEFWQSAGVFSLTALADVKDLPSTVRCAYDEDYLYLSIQCPRNPNSLAVPVVKRRSHDADLSGQDHVELMIDTDRDYTSTIRLAVAENGLTYDRCLDFDSFNPKWYLSVQSARESWQAEIAIPFASLTDLPVGNGEAWAISARRLRPNAEPQSWSQLRTHLPLPEAAGILLFK